MQKVCLIVTGASRGLGRAIAITLSRQLVAHGLDSIGSNKLGRTVSDRCESRQVHTVLVARSESGLQETESNITQSFAGFQSNIGERDSTDTCLTVSKVVADLGDLSTLDATINDILERCHTHLSSSQATMESKCRIIFINNAGSLGHVGLCTDTTSLWDLQRAIDLNVTSSLWLSLKIKQWALVAPHVSARIVNISSLCAVQPMPTMALYSAGKAARDAYHAAMAQEGRPDSLSTAAATPALSRPDEVEERIRILNYAPGPLETDMTTILRNTDALDATLQPHFRKQLVDPMDSAAVLSRLLSDDTTYLNGAHVDYYDCLS